MKIALLNDTHFGCRNDSPAFLNYQNRFYNELFFPYLKESVIENLLEETNWRKLRYYSLYEKAFRTYKVSKVSMPKLIQYETLPQRKLRLKQ